MPLLNTLSIIALLAGGLTGCASVISGTAQLIRVETNPPDARCDLTREGKPIGSVEHTPGGVNVQRTKHDIDVVCTKAGFIDGAIHADSGLENYTIANALFGIFGLVGWGVDAATGAHNQYPKTLNLSMVPDPNESATNTANTPLMPSAPQQPSPTLSRTTVQPSGEALKKKLEALEQLRKDGILTEDEYKTKRASAINGF